MIARLFCRLFGHKKPLRQFKLPPYFDGVGLRNPIQPKRGFWRCDRCGGLVIGPGPNGAKAKVFIGGQEITPHSTGPGMTARQWGGTIEVKG